MNIGFTGTQQGMSERQRTALETVLKPYYSYSCKFLHGRCIGADAEAAHIADSENFFVVGYTPTNEEKMDASIPCDELKEPQNYIDRNHAIVDDCDLLIAAPGGHTEWQRSGTWATVRYARKQGKPCIILDR